MTIDGDDPERRMVTALFRAVLEQPEPERPAVLAEVRAGGRRLRARRRLSLAASALAVLGLGLVTAVAVGVPVRVGPAHGEPSEQPSSYGMDQLDALHDRLRTVLGRHLPPGFTAVRDGSGPTTFRLDRADGGVTAVAAIMGNPLPPGSREPSPCEPQDGKPAFASNCRFRTLADGSTGWLYESPATQDASFVIVTPQGKVTGLGSLPIAAPPQSEGGETRPAAALTLDELEALAGDPEVLAALKGVPLDAPG